MLILYPYNLISFLIRISILYYYFLIIFPRRNHFFLNLSGGKMINNWIRILLSIIFTNSNPIPTHYNYFSPSDRSEGGATHFLKSWVSLRFCVCKVSSPGGLVPRAGKKGECWTFLDWRLNSENDSPVHGQPARFGHTGRKLISCGAGLDWEAFYISISFLVVETGSAHLRRVNHCRSSHPTQSLSSSPPRSVTLTPHPREERQEEGK